MIAVSQINNAITEKAKKTLIITFKRVASARVLKLFFHAEGGIVFNMFQNFEIKLSLVFLHCSY